MERKCESYLQAPVALPKFSAEQRLDMFARAVEPRPSATAGKSVFTYTGVNAGIPMANAPNILGKSYTVTAEVDIPQGGGNGMLVTAGGRWGGWGLYIVDGKPIFDYNMLVLAHYRWVGEQALTPGKHTIVFDYTYDDVVIENYDPHPAIKAPVAV